MAANNSTLQIEVVSVGIAETVRRLDSLGNAAGRNEARVKLLTDSLGSLMVAQTTAVSSAAAHAAAMNALAQAMGLIATSATSTANQVTLLNSQLTSLSSTSNTTTAAFNQNATSGGIVNATIRAMTTAALAYLGINFAKGIVEASDGWAMMQSKLKLATGSMDEAKKVQADLFDVAQRIRVPLDDIGKLYTRMSIPMQRMGKDSSETAKQVEFVALALKLNGATAAEASSVMLQYSQSVNAGRLNGAEFNAVAEGAPGILRAIEEELKATGKWSEFGGKSLKQMGSDGEITFDLMNRAAQRALPKMRKDFEELPLTVDGALQRVKNAWFKAMGEMGADTEMGKKLAKAIAQLEEDIPKIRDVLASIFSFLYENFSKIATVIEGILIGKFIQWIAGAALALGPLYTALLAVTTAGAGVTTVMGGLSAALTLLTGPVGMAVALIGTALVGAYLYFAKEAPKAEAVVTAATRVETVDRLKLIQKEIDKINERNNKLATGAAYEVTANDKEQVDLITRMNGLKSAQIALTNDGTKAGIEGTAAAKKGMQITLDDLGRQLTLMQGQQTVLEGLKKVNLDVTNAGKVDVVNKKYAQDFETKVEKAARLVKAYRDEVTLFNGVPDENIIKRINLETLDKAKVDKVDHFQKLSSAIKATTAELQLNIAAGEKASAAEKVRVGLESGKNVDYNKLSAGNKTTIDEMVQLNKKLEDQIDVRDRSSKATIDAAAEDDKYNAKLQSGVIAINDQIDRTRLQIAALTQSKTAVKELANAMFEADARLLESQALKQIDKNGNVVAYDLLMAQAAATRLLGEEQVKLGKGQDDKLANDALDKLLDPKKAFNFGAALADAFGEAGKAIGGMSKALGVFAADQKAVGEDRDMFLKLDDSTKRTAGLEALDRKEAQSKLRLYGAMAGGAKDFFSQNTAAYKVLAVAEKGFRVAELAGTIYNFAVKEGLLAAFTGLFIGAKATEAGVDSAQTVFMLSEHAAANAADVALTGTAEAAKNTLKIPGVLLSFMSWLGPWGMAAGGVAIAAVLGASIGGGGGGGSTFDLAKRQAGQGTGTVLGDDSAKSDSIAKSISGLESNSNIGLVLTSNMLASLRGIEASMLGLSTAIYKVPGMTTGKNFGIQEGNAGGGFLSSVFGGKTSTSIVDTGLSLNGTAGQFQQGSGIQQYVDVNHQKSGGWFSKDKSWNTRDMMTADSDITKTIGRVFEGINSTISTAAVALGGNGEAIRAALDAFVVNTEVSFKGLKGDELQQALNAVFSAAADGMAQQVFPGLVAFQKAGEGYYQTVMRVSTGTEQAQNALKGLGVTMVDKDSLTNKTGDFAVELVRQSIMASTAGSTMSDIMKVMGGSLTDLVDGYKSLLNIQDTMNAARLGKGISIDTIRGAGGLSELKGALDSFVDGFYSGAEKQAISFAKLRAEFGRLNTTMPATKEGFKQLVTSLMAGDAASQELAGRVLLLGGAFADAYAATETARTDAISKAKDNLSSAYGSEATALQNIVDKMKGFSDSLKTFKDSLTTGDLSTKSTAEKYATAKANYDSTATLALGGDQTAIGNFEKAATEMLKFSRDVNASGAGYSADYDRVLTETEALRKFTSTQVDVATASLDTLKEQVKGLIDIKDSVLTVTEAIVALHIAMAAGNPSMGAADSALAKSTAGSPLTTYIGQLQDDGSVTSVSEANAYKAGLGSDTSKSDADMCSEIKALREELKQLRQEQREQTANVISAQYDSSERNAHTVVAGNKHAMEDASYLERTKTGFA